MNKRPRALLSVLAILLAVGCATASPTAPPTPGPGVPDAEHGADRELIARADAWDRAIVAKDRAAIEANMADDFRQIDGAGNLETKKSFVDGLMLADLAIAPYTVEDLEIRRYGDVALLSGRIRMSGTFQGKPFANHFRYIDIYVHGPKGWRVVSVQISKIAE